ncbi:hypothetical protein ACFL2S_15245 [Thermodesulfobacteriota bacterium]
MSENKQVPLMLSIPKEYRDKLRKLAAGQNLENTNQVTSASTIARKIVCAYFDNLEAESGTP